MRREAVEVDAEDQIDVIGDIGYQLVVEVELVEGQCLSFGIKECDVVVLPVEHIGAVARVIDRTAALDGEAGVVLVVVGLLADGESKRATYLLDLRELCGGPLTSVDELPQVVLQGLEPLVKACLKLTGIDGDGGVELLGIHVKRDHANA